MRSLNQSIIGSEILDSMKRQMIKDPEVEKTFAKIASALDSLDKAAELFEHIGFDKEAEVITRLIEKISQNSK